jgi:elongator complex protein 3
VAGNKRTSLRQDIQAEMEKRGTSCQCVRCREVRDQKVRTGELEYHDLVYHLNQFEEHFISYDTEDDRLAGFLRLSLPGEGAPQTEMDDLRGAALIREVHVYGQSLEVGEKQVGLAQHAGLGTSLLEAAERIARDSGYRRIAVIAAVGTAQYYLARGFERGESYLVKDLA